MFLARFCFFGRRGRRNVCVTGGVAQGERGWGGGIWGGGIIVCVCVQALGDCLPVHAHYRHTQTDTQTHTDTHTRTHTQELGDGLQVDVTGPRFCPPGANMRESVRACVRECVCMCVCVCV